MQELAPLPLSTGVCEPEHFVQFYESDSFLLDSLTGFIGAGLCENDACIVVATKPHRDALDERLQACGIDVDAAKATGQFISLDAAETLAKFTIDGSPDHATFRSEVGSLIAGAAETRSNVRVFGEMVALLWADGNSSAALNLEELWNDLHKDRPFSLFCAYPMEGFGGDSRDTGLSNVCTSHGRVIPAESYSALTNPEDRLRTIIHLQQKANLLEAEISVRTRAEGELRAAKDELEALLNREQLARAEAESANRLKDEFLATVSHELRTPLNAIIGWSHLLRNGKLDEATVARALKTIERNAHSQAQLIEDILDVSRVITGKLRLSIGTVDLASIINSAIDSVQPAADAKGIQLEVMLDRSARHVMGDVNRLQQVIWNLLSNAIKFTPFGGRVQVSLEHANQNAQIRVSDSGQGISAGFLPFIFDRFRQADGTSTRRHGGLGLGLAIVRHLVELHGGTVEASSPGEGLGSTFTISLPLAVDVKKVTTRRIGTGSLRTNDDASMQSNPLPSLADVKVLLVDDNQDTLLLLAAMLTDCNAVVQTADTSAEGLEIFQWYKPDVVVSDLAMPDEDGYSFIAKVRAIDAERGTQTPAVALTAYVRVSDRARALSAGFDLFVPKPVEQDELVIAVFNLARPMAGQPLFSPSEIM